MVAPAGTINVGQKELGPYFGSPLLAGNPQIFLNNAAPITETLGMYDFNSNKVVPMLAESWDISADGKTWTYHIRRGVQFHKGFGEMTAEDVVFFFGQIRDSEKHARASNARKIFFADDGEQSTPDDFTWVVNSGVAFSDMALATSGTYRNFREIDGQRYGRTLDARTGAPVTHRLAAVTVLHEDAVWADAYTKDFMVLGPENGLEVASDLGTSAV